MRQQKRTALEKEQPLSGRGVAHLAQIQPRPLYRLEHHLVSGQRRRVHPAGHQAAIFRELKGEIISTSKQMRRMRKPYSEPTTIESNMRRTFSDFIGSTVVGVVCASAQEIFLESAWQNAIPAPSVAIGAGGNHI